jgi:hypothetical protein
VDDDSIAITPPANEGFLRVIETGAGEILTTRVILAGAAARPSPNPTAAVGVAVISIEGDTLALDIAYQNLSATATAAHIHGPASIEQTAGPMINLAPYHQGDFATQGMFTGSVELTANQKNNILSGLSYINIHSSTYPGGEIRGQIIFPE